jgi:hypothetical protein
MTVRGGGVPRKPWLSCRCAEWARRLGAFAADAQDCIMVRVIAAHRIQGCGTNVRAPQASSPRPRHPTITSVLPCSELSRCGLASPGHEEIFERRPTLTAPARDSVWSLRVGTWRNRGTGSVLDRVENGGPGSDIDPASGEEPSSHAHFQGPRPPSLPPCSRPSMTSPPGGPKRGRH